jgi:hypothetical protein
MYSDILPTYKDYSLLGVIAIACGLTYYYMSLDTKENDDEDEV